VAAPRLVLPVAAALLALVTRGVASAQVHWDAGAKAGLTKRFEAGGDAAAPTPGPGPSLELQGHVALLPMIRLGLYAATDLSPAMGRGAAADGPHAFAAGGLHVRVSPPLMPWPWRTWLFAGFGYAEGHDFETRLSGGMLDVPVGLGIGRRVTRRGWLFSELGARFGSGFHGALYQSDGAGVAGQGGSVPYAGKDVFALSWSVGLSLEE
jgi:hypothetical protein